MIQHANSAHEPIERPEAGERFFRFGNKAEFDPERTAQRSQPENPADRKA